MDKLSGVNNSQKLTEKKREELYPEIIEKALDYTIVDENKKPKNTAKYIKKIVILFLF